jgi:hypothetical protein
MTFSKKQLDSDNSIELRLQDKSKLDDRTPITSDEALYEIASIKENINANILQAVKEASIDCALHTKAGAEGAGAEGAAGAAGAEQLKCFTFGAANPNKFSYNPSIAEEEMDVVTEKNKAIITWKAVEVMLEGIMYAYKKDTGEVYDLESYKAGQPVQVGMLTITGEGAKAQYKFAKI